MKVCFLFNKVLGTKIDDFKAGRGHDSWLYGLLRVRKFGIDSDYLEIERIFPKWFSGFLRKKFLTMHYAHLPLFPFLYKYDIVFTSTAYGTMILRAILKSLYIKVPKWVILDFNILGTIKDGSQIRQKIFKWAVSKVDGIIAISDAEAVALKMEFPHLKDRIVFLHEATDIDYFKPSVLPEENFILSVGNYGRDFKTIIEAVRGLDIKLVLATKLIKPDDKTLPDNVTAGLYSHREMLDLYAKAKIVIISLDVDDRYFDSVGTLSVGEAFAMGKATLVTHTKSMESYVIHGKNAMFIEPKNINQTRNVIKDVILKDELRKSLGIEARGFAKQYLDPDKFAKSLAGFLGKI